MSENTCTCGGTKDPNCGHCNPEPDPLEPPPDELVPGVPRPPFDYRQPAPKRRVGFARAAIGLSVVIVAAIAYAVSPPLFEDPLPHDIGFGVISCSRAHVDWHVPATRVAYFCKWGGKFTCTKEKCWFYPWERDPSKRKWRPLAKSESASMPGGMDHFFEVGKERQ